MFYACVRAVVGFALRLFYRVTVRGSGAPPTGAVMYVGNHPNSIIDPAMVLAVVQRPITFLAKAPLFEAPVFGWLLRRMGALPVYRRQDDAALVERNEGTLAAASQALTEGRAVSIFPEGKSHSEPRVAEIKTGAARIAQRASRQGAEVTIVPVGLTYADKHRFRSEVIVEVGEAIPATELLRRAPDEVEAVRALTERIDGGLRHVTLNLEEWEDLPLIRLGEELYASRIGERARDPDRLRRFARGLELFRREQPERFERLRTEVTVFQRRLELVDARTRDLTLQYRKREVWAFIARNLSAVLLGFPLFVSGVVLYALPFYVPRWINGALKQSLDRQATVKFVCALVLTPLWLALLTSLAWTQLSPAAGVVTLVGALPLAVFTRYFLERRRIALRDVRVFFALGNRGRLKALLRAEGERLSEQIERVAEEFRPRVTDVEATRAVS